MDTREINNIFYYFKEKITDKEYKDIMDNLMIIDKEQTENDIL